MNELIASLAYKASEGYIQNKADLNATIRDSYLSGEIENTEVLKRVCEEANKATKLAILQDSIAGGTVIFNYATPEKVMGNIDTSLSDYMVAPKSAAMPIEVEKVASDPEVRREAIALGRNMEKFASQLRQESLRSEGSAAKALIKVATMARDYIYAGGSVPDLCKIAACTSLSACPDRTVAMEIPTLISKIASDIKSRGLNVCEKVATEEFDIDANDPLVKMIKVATEEMVTAASYHAIHESVSSFSKDLMNECR